MSAATVDGERSVGEACSYKFGGLEGSGKNYEEGGFLVRRLSNCLE